MTGDWLFGVVWTGGLACPDPRGMAAQQANVDALRLASQAGMLNSREALSAAMQNATSPASGYAVWSDAYARTTLVADLRRLSVPDWHLAAWLVAGAIALLLKAL